MVFKVGLALYQNRSSLLYQSLWGVSPSETPQNSSFISSLPSATGAGTSGGPRPLEIEQEIDQDLIWENLAAQEQEARAREHARIYEAVEAIIEACEKEEAAMIDKAHILLQKKGITLEDPKDVKRALETVLYDDWQHDIDERLSHFRGLKRDFGTARCSIWNKFIDELRELGNPQSPSLNRQT